MQIVSSAVEYFHRTINWIMYNEKCFCLYVSFLYGLQLHHISILSPIGFTLMWKFTKRKLCRDVVWSPNRQSQPIYPHQTLHLVLDQTVHRPLYNPDIRQNCQLKAESCAALLPTVYLKLLKWILKLYALI